MPSGAEYGLSGRWATNFNRQRDFILLYSENETEATLLCNALVNRHKEYLNQLGAQSGLSRFEQQHNEAVTMDVL